MVVFEQVSQSRDYSFLFVHVMLACDHDVSVTKRTGSGINPIAITDLGTELLSQGMKRRSRFDSIFPEPLKKLQEVRLAAVVSIGGIRSRIITGFDNEASFGFRPVPAKQLHEFWI